MQSAARGRQCQSLCGHDDNLHRFKFAHRKRMRNRSCSTYYTLLTRPLLIARQCFWWASLWKHYVDNVSNHHHVHIHNRFIILIDWLIERVAMLCVCVCVSRAYIRLSTSFAYACVMSNLVSRSIAFHRTWLVRLSTVQNAFTTHNSTGCRFVDSTPCRFAVNLML